MSIVIFLSVSTIGTNELQLSVIKRRANASGILSVSTIGTNELQQPFIADMKQKYTSFSFHNRNERTATNANYRNSSRDSLSFSFHNRNERTATARRFSTYDARARFQFPQSERTNCNKPVILATSEILKLSVSTIGTNELQLDLEQGVVIVRENFQFPQSERTNCNCRNELNAWSRHSSFSFHNRNERTATRTQILYLRGLDTLSVSTIGTNELQQ